MTRVQVETAILNHNSLIPGHSQNLTCERTFSCSRMGLCSIIVEHPLIKRHSALLINRLILGFKQKSPVKQNQKQFRVSSQSNLVIKHMFSKRGPLPQGGSWGGFKASPTLRWSTIMASWLLDENQGQKWFQTWEPVADLRSVWLSSHIWNCAIIKIRIRNGRSTHELSGNPKDGTKTNRSLFL